MTMIHPTADVQSKDIGQATTLWQYCVVLSGAKIGKNCTICCHVFVENDVQVGDNVTIKSGVQLWDGVRLEDNVFIGPNVTFTNDISPRSKRYPDSLLKTTVRHGATIGANSTILAGITIGRYAMIGAGSVVTRSVPDYTLWYGNPAVFKGYVCKCGDKLNALFTCRKCGTAYKFNEQMIVPQ